MNKWFTVYIVDVVTKKGIFTENVKYSFEGTDDIVETKDGVFYYNENDTWHKTLRCAKKKGKGTDIFKSTINGYSRKN